MSEIIKKRGGSVEGKMKQERPLLTIIGQWTHWGAFNYPTLCTFDYVSNFPEQIKIVLQNVTLEPDTISSYYVQLLSLTKSIWLWASQLFLPSLSFLLCKMVMTNMKCRNIRAALSSVPGTRGASTRLRKEGDVFFRHRHSGQPAIEPNLLAWL